MSLVILLHGARWALTTGATAPVGMRVVWASVLAEALPAKVARLTYLRQYLIVISRLHPAAAGAAKGLVGVCVS